MIRRTTARLLLALTLCLLFAPTAAFGSARAFPGFGDCKSPPAPEPPGQGVSAFFMRTPAQPPAPGDPFRRGTATTIFEQYGYAGLHWSTYDLGCGPGVVNHPDAVIGNTIANWVMQLPIALTALTGSITQYAFHPTFLDSFDPVISRISTALHNRLFATWVPLVLALLGAAILFKARRAALATTASAIGWAIIVVLVATALFRWPVQAGHAADGTVTGTLGTVVAHLDGHGPQTDPGTAVASTVEQSVLFRAWVAGELGSADSPTAKKYGPALFRAQTLTWREAQIVQHDPQKGQALLGAKQAQWKDIAAQVRQSDPEAYENLTGKRPETRIGYAVLAAVACCLALPFLLVSALLLLGCFLIVRLAVMMFPAFATIGAFPSARGLVLGLGRTVGAAIVNAIVFGIGAGVTIAVIGLLYAPGGGTPAWLGMILMPLFSFLMWMGLKPFRRLTHMVSPHSDHFSGMAGAPERTARSGGHLLRKVLAVAAGGVAGGAAAEVLEKKQDDGASPYQDRAEARPVGEYEPGASAGASFPVTPSLSAGPSPGLSAGPSAGVASGPAAGPASGTTSGTASLGLPSRVGAQADPSDPGEATPPQPKVESMAAAPVAPEWVDGEEVYPIYRPRAVDTGPESEHAA